MLDKLLGLGACILSSVLFGSMYVLVRNYKIGDGIFVQWIVCSGIFLVGIIINLILKCPQFQPFAMLGGFLWAIGNVTALPIINVIGLGTGILIWGTTNCFIGWATGRFGLFDLKKEIPTNPIINYIGLATIIIGGSLFAIIKPTVKNKENIEQTEESRLVNSNNYLNQPINDEHQSVINDSNGTSINLKIKIIAIIVSAFAGLCYGSTFTPVNYIIDHPNKFNNATSKSINYTFSHFSGIYLTSTILLILYIIFKKNKPFVNNKIILPSFFSGLLWAIAQLSWFYANDKVSLSITFPIVSMMPGVCGALWSVFYFKEIEGKQNYQILIVATLITLFGAILVGASK